MSLPMQILQEVIGQLHEQMKAAADLVSGIGKGLSHVNGVILSCTVLQSSHTCVQFWVCLMCQ